MTSRGLAVVLIGVLSTLLLVCATTGVSSATSANQYFVQQLYCRYTGRKPGASDVGYSAVQIIASPEAHGQAQAEH